MMTSVSYISRCAPGFAGSGAICPGGKLAGPKSSPPASATVASIMSR
jgi:hypothetical protein